MIFTFLGEIATSSAALGISTGSYCSKVIGAKGKKRDWKHMQDVQWCGIRTFQTGVKMKLLAFLPSVILL